MFWNRRREAIDVLRGVDVLIIDALRHKAHPTHLCIPESVALAEELNCGQTWLTHIAHEVSHAKEEEDLPTGVQIAYDELKLSL